MAEHAAREDPFRRQLGIILILKEDIQPQFDTAIDLASTPDDLYKLTAIVSKAENELRKIKQKLSSRCSAVRSVPNHHQAQGNGVPRTANGSHTGSVHAPKGSSNGKVSSSKKSYPSGSWNAQGVAVPILSAGRTIQAASPPMQPNSWPQGFPEKEHKKRSVQYHQEPQSVHVTHPYEWRNPVVFDRQFGGLAAGVSVHGNSTARDGVIIDGRGQNCKTSETRSWISALPKLGEEQTVTMHFDQQQHQFFGFHSPGSPEYSVWKPRSNNASEHLQTRRSPMDSITTTTGDASTTAKGKRKRTPKVPSLPHNCQVCGKECASKQRLTSHMRVHSSERPFVCDICGSTFKHQPNLVTHKKRHQAPAVSSPAVGTAGSSAPFVRTLSQLKKKANLDRVLKKIAGSASDSDGDMRDGDEGMGSIRNFMGGGIGELNEMDSLGSTDV